MIYSSDLPDLNWIDNNSIGGANAPVFLWAEVNNGLIIAADMKVSPTSKAMAIQDAPQYVIDSIQDKLDFKLHEKKLMFMMYNHRFIEVQMKVNVREVKCIESVYRTSNENSSYPTGYGPVGIVTLKRKSCYFKRFGMVSYNYEHMVKQLTAQMVLSKITQESINGDY